MELERVLGLAFQLKRKRSRLSGSQGSAKKSRSGEDGSSSVTSIDEEVGSSCSSSSIDDEQVVEVQRQGRDYADVADLFLRGLGVLLSDTSIEGIEKVYESEGSRYEFEKKQVEMERDGGGDANVQWAWYGACKEEIESIVKNGFRTAVPSSVGYCFAPVECSRISAVQAKEDDVGEQRLILCQVAVGKVGLISSRNMNDQSFDTGVYDVSNPKVLILPAARFEPSRILSHHVVRFKLSDQWREIIEASTIVGKSHPGGSQRKTKLKTLSPGAPVPDGLSKHSMTSCKIMSFPTLFWILQSKIPQLNLSELQQKYDAFKNGGLSKLEFIHEVRRIAGDALLYKCMCFIKLWSQGCEHAH